MPTIELIEKEERQEQVEMDTDAATIYHIHSKSVEFGSLILVKIGDDVVQWTSPKSGIVRVTLAVPKAGGK